MKGIDFFLRVIVMSPLIGMASLLIAQPQPGDVFREYIWTIQNVDGQEKHLRIGGKLDYRNTPENFNEQIGKDGWIKFPYILDLKKAVRAELQIEKNLCHEGTKGLSVSFNNHHRITFPESDSIPTPQWNYLHHTYPVVPIPLSDLKKAYNTFMFEVDTAQEWNWPQNLIYGMILRIYYEKTLIQQDVKWVTPRRRSTLPEKTVLEVKAEKSKIVNVDFMAEYEDVNYEGDGVYRRWHYHYYTGKMIHHIGSKNEAPFKVTWNTDWVPDQKQLIRMGAIITFIDDFKYFLPPVTGLQFDRDYSVKLYKPSDQPEKWTTRSGIFSEKVHIPEDPEEALGCQLVWTSWSPCYGNGVYINDRVVLTREGPCYDYFFHRVNLRKTDCFKSGENIITTGKTPLDHEGNMVHGMDVQWPGIMVLMKYKK